MKQLFQTLLSATAMLILSCGCDTTGPDPVETPSPKILLDKDSLTFDYEGGDMEVGYSILYPVDGGIVNVGESASWLVSELTEADSVIVLSVSSNDGETGRKAKVSIVYYGAGQTAEAEISVFQSAKEKEYDMEFAASAFSGEYNGNSDNPDAAHEYIVRLSDKPFSPDGLQGESTCYTFYMYAPAPQDPQSPVLASGNYVFSQDGSSEMTFSAMSSYSTTDNTGAVIADAAISSGEITVSMDGGNMSLEAVVIDDADRKHHVTYSGSALFESNVGTGNDEIIAEDIDIVPTQVIARYYSDSDGIMRVGIDITDMALDEYGWTTPPGNTLKLIVFMPFDRSGNPSTGTYTVSSVPPGESFTITQGRIVDGEYGPSPEGSYLEKVIGFYEGYKYGAVDKGTVTISGEPGAYSLDCNLTTPEGFSITAKYTGNLAIQDVPMPNSTLTGDYELNLTGAVGSATVVENWNGGTFYSITIRQSSGEGDEIRVQLVSEGSKEEGLAGGTYTASDSYSLNHYMVGSLSYGSPQGTYYIGGYGDDGYSVIHGAPATGGDLVVTDDNGTLTFTFSFTDDIGYVWSGQWSGHLDIQ